MRFSKTNRWILTIASAPLLCVALYLVACSGSGDKPPPVYVAIAAVGYTNNAQGQTLPQFSVSNVSVFRIECSVVGSQIQVTNVIRGKRTNVVWGWITLSTNLYLEPGQAIIVPVQLPTNTVPWRFGVFATRPLSLWETGADKLAAKLPTPVSSIIQSDRRRTQVVQSRTFEATEK
jgi:hypothetical protein